MEVLRDVVKSLFYHYTGPVRACKKALKGPKSAKKSPKCAKTKNKKTGQYFRSQNSYSTLVDPKYVIAPDSNPKN